MDHYSFRKLDWRKDSYGRDDFFYGLASICPHCTKGMTPEVLTKTFWNNQGFMVLKCTACKEAYFSILSLCNDEVKESLGFDEYLKMNPNDIRIFKATETFPEIAFEKFNFPEKIVELYPQFARIYNQAETAGKDNLDEICGIGYRKALEVLVKENLCNKNPDEKETIYSETLAQSVARYKYETVKKVAKAATWLGNDEAHMVRKHLSYDTQYLKKLISVLVHIIEAEHIADSDLGRILDSPK